jgi:hypothetical protein
VGGRDHGGQARAQGQSRQQPAVPRNPGAAAKARGRGAGGEQDQHGELVDLVDRSQIGVTGPDVGRKGAEPDEERHERDPLVGQHRDPAQCWF